MVKQGGSVDVVLKYELAIGDYLSFRFPALKSNGNRWEEAFSLASLVEARNDRKDRYEALEVYCRLDNDRGDARGYACRQAGKSQRR